jgi:hypothetical protein
MKTNLSLLLALLAAAIGLGTQDGFCATTDENNNWSLPQETSLRFMRPLPTPHVAGEVLCFAGKSRHVAVHFLLAPIAEPHRFVAIAERKPLGNLLNIDTCALAAPAQNDKASIVENIERTVVVMIFPFEAHSLESL